MSIKRIYLDNNATTPLDPLVIEAMKEELSKGPRNPSSIHFFGQEAKKTLLSSRQTIAKFLNVKPHEIVFTSSGTESLNLLIHGLLPKERRHLITTDLEHPCIYENMKALDAQGIPITFLSPGLRGSPSPEELKAAICSQTGLIILSAVNSETGSKLDLANIAAVAQAADIPLIIDGVALLGKEPFMIPPGVTGMGFSGHKIHGPKGIGFFFLRSGTKLKPLLLGGNQENGLRSGTENLLGIVGLAQAISILNKNIERYAAYMKELRDFFETTLKKRLPNLKINGTGLRVGNISNLCFPQVDGESLLIQLDMAGIATSHATACSSGSLEISRTLLNMGISKNDAHSSLRFSLSRMNTKKEILKTIETLVTILR